MEKDDWKRVARLIGYVYLPIVLLVIGIFILIQYQSMKIGKLQKDLGAPTSTTEVSTVESAPIPSSLLRSQ